MLSGLSAQATGVAKRKTRGGVGELRSKLVQGWLASKWDQDRRSLSTLEETDLASCSEGGYLFSSTDSQVKAEEFKQVQWALDLLVAINKEGNAMNVDGDDNERSLHLFTTDMLAWILPKLCEDDGASSRQQQDQQQQGSGLSSANVIQVGRALGEMPPHIIDTAEIRGLAPVLGAVVEVANRGKTLPAAARGLGIMDAATLAFFRIDQFMRS